MYVRSHKVIQLVQDPVDDLDQQVSLLVLQSGGHEQRKDLVEQRISTKLPSLISDCSQSRLCQREEGRGGEGRGEERRGEERRGGGGGGERGGEGEGRGRGGGGEGEGEGEGDRHKFYLGYYSPSLVHQIVDTSTFTPYHPSLPSHHTFPTSPSAWEESRS